MLDKKEIVISLNSFKEKKRAKDINLTDTSYKPSIYKPFRAHSGFYFPILNCMLLPGTPI